MISILLTSASVASSGLQVTIGIGAYPYTLPRRGDSQTLDPLQNVDTANPFATAVEIPKCALLESPYDARSRVGHIAKPGIVC